LRADAVAAYFFASFMFFLSSFTVGLSLPPPPPPLPSSPLLHLLRDGRHVRRGRGRSGRRQLGSFLVRRHDARDHHGRDGGILALRHDRFTPGRQLEAETCSEWPGLQVREVDLDELRQVLRKHWISSSFITCSTRPPAIFTPGEIASFTKCSGTDMWIFLLASTRWKSTCRMIGRNGMHLVVAEQHLRLLGSPAPSRGWRRGTLPS
jgi:hypothetical protein